MKNQQTQESVAEAIELPIDFVSGTKGFLGNLSSQQIIKLALLGLGLLAWYPLYRQLVPFSNWVAYDLFRIPQGSHLGESVAFFFLDVPKVFMLLLLIVWAVGVVRSFFTPERTRAILAGKRQVLSAMGWQGLWGW